MSLRLRLILSFGFMGLGLVLVSFSAYRNLNNVDATYSNLTSQSVPKLGDLSGLRTRATQVQVHSLRLAYFRANPDLAKAASEDLKKSAKRYKEIEAEYEARGFFSAKEKEIFNSSKAMAENIIGRVDSFENLVRNGNAEQLEKFLLQLNKEAADHQKTLKELDDLAVDTSSVWSSEAKATSDASEKFILIVSGLTIALSLVLGFFLTRWIMNTISDLSVRLQSTIQEVTGGSMKLTRTSQTLAESSTEQAAAVQQTASATNEISAMIQRTIEHCGQSIGRAQSAEKATSVGLGAVQDVMQAMGQIESANHAISDRVRLSNSNLEKMVTVIHSIHNKTQVIHDIVFQTKLLSFNASVEAARAGEHGKGFAVVAEEVGNLAQMSGNAAKEIAELLDRSTKQIEDIINESKDNLSFVTEGERKVSEGRDKAANCQATFSEIVSEMKELIQLTKSISSATEEQSHGVREINQAIAQIDKTTNLNSTLSNDCSESASALHIEVEKTDQVQRELMMFLYGNSGVSEGLLAEVIHPEPNKVAKSAA